MKSLFLCLVYIVVGGLLFWAPQVALQVLQPNGMSNKQMWLITFALPVILAGLHFFLHRLRRRREAGPSVALFIALGIWIVGPMAMMISASYHEGGFTIPGVWVLVVFATLFPPYTCIMATYDGSLLALAWTTVVMLALHWRFERGNWLLPPFIGQPIRRFLNFPVG